MKRWALFSLRPISPWWWLPVAVVLVAIDYFTGPYFQFPAVYVVPVTLAAWLSGLVPGLVLAVTLPLIRLGFMLEFWGEPWDAQTILATALTRVGVFSLMAVMAARLAAHERAVMQRVDVLTSLLPMCSYCRRIRGADDGWTTIDQLAGPATFQFATGLCPDCAASHLPAEYAPVSEKRTAAPHKSA